MERRVAERLERVMARSFREMVFEGGIDGGDLLMNGQGMPSSFITQFFDHTQVERKIVGSTVKLFGVDISASASASSSSSAAADLSLLVGDSTMSNSSPSASASASVADPSLFGDYEVFLNFCGQDTRYGFTDYLYNSLIRIGIRTFRDDNELRLREEIGPELVRAINDSKISIPIFSKNYASKKWCLIELAHMVQCWEIRGQKFFPIFYNVTPDDVQHQLNSYEEAFRQHKKRRYDGKVIQEWKDALKIVGQIKGLELEKETGRHEGQLVTIITDTIFRILMQNNKHEDSDLIGMVSRIEKVDKLLNIHCDGVRFIGIHGMGGLGKTTTAEVIYNKYQHHFECHSFLPDVRETESRNGIVHLQTQLLSAILKTRAILVNDCMDGIRQIKGVVGRKKVLIVLDDVNDKSQIEGLAGSWKWFGARSRIIITTRNKEVLRALESTTEEGNPEVYGSYQPDYLDPVESLELFCKHAFGRKNPPEDYKTLSEGIASTAAGLPLVLKVTGSSLYGETDKELWEYKIKELKDVPDEEVQKKLRLSFDPLTDAQKEIFLDIACLFIGHDKTNLCYMWDDCGFHPGIVLNVLVRRSLITVGDDDILSMHDQLRDLGRQIVREEKLDKLGKWSRLWDSDKAFEVYETGQGTAKVKALRLDHGPSTISFWNTKNTPNLIGEKFLKLPSLRYLNLGHESLYGDFEHCLQNLRLLRWKCFTPQFRATNLLLRNLVILDLSDSLIEEDCDLWSQIQMLDKLKVLDLSCCKWLRSVPFLSTFSNLERLAVKHCRKLCSLDGIEELGSLRYLGATGCLLLETLPNLSRLTKLKELEIEECGLITDIPGLDKLESLELLNMNDCCSVKRLPDLSNLKRLKRLEFTNGSELIELRGLDGLESLEYLNMGFCKYIETLPDLSKLKSLKELSVMYCEKLTEIRGLEELKSLKRLYIGGCMLIENLPNFSNLRKLEFIDASGCKKLTEIRGLEELKSLEHLNIGGCKLIENLPNFSNLRKLEFIDAFGCEKLTEIRGLEELKSLDHLDIGGCKLIENLPNFSNLRKLESIDASGCEKLTEIRGLEELKSLERLQIGGCKLIENLPNFSNLRKLKSIDASGCKKLTEIRGLEELKSLERLQIGGCKLIENLPNFSNLRKLESIDASGCEKLTEIRGLENLESFCRLFIYGCETFDTAMYSQVPRIRIYK
ncbi:hypothetical protein LguiB_013445 [Lonicera macranthoides]